MTASDAIRTVTAKVQNEIEAGRQAAGIDAFDLIDILLEIAELIEADEPAAG